VISFAQLQAHQSLPNADRPQYSCRTHLNLYKSPALEGLVTQAAAGRYLRVVPLSEAEQGTTPAAIAVCLCEDDYPGWLAIADLEQLDIADPPYQPVSLSEAEIRKRVQGAIAFAEAAMARPNQYLWGGTVAPDYDCSGLVQAAFADVGIWLPRDAYQQEGFTQAISSSELLPGDLVFFGPPAKATHVGLYLGESCYIHSSGKDQGRNGIGIDRLSESGDRVSQAYFAQRRGAGRIVACYQPASCT
jgi:cell wall-associated NlpC family hydrolase